MAPDLVDGGLWRMAGRRACRCWAASPRQSWTRFSSHAEDEVKRLADAFLSVGGIGVTRRLIVAGIVALPILQYT
jgi:hypothetical protein